MTEEVVPDTTVSTAGESAAVEDGPSSESPIENDNAADNNVTDSESSSSNNNNNTERIGSISSARFNILSTMVGGGCLSLPLAFSKSGNAGIGPLLLLFVGLVTNFCFGLLVQISRQLHPPSAATAGTDTFESITKAAFGPKANVLSMGLVVLMCFFGTVGYSVLLRDMVEPLNDWLLGVWMHQPQQTADDDDDNKSWFHTNFTMFLVVFLVTPFCTLRRLTALKDCGALSMVSLLILGTCIVIRSVQCNLGMLSNGDDDDGDDLLLLLLSKDHDPWYSHLKFWPDSWHDLLDASPLYISCFVCHYNILPVHNELVDPTKQRVHWWLSSTTGFAVVLYMVMGFAGSAYAHCTPTGTIQGNILLDFDEHDPLLMVGRMCLAVTITLAFPMLVIPGRDICVRSILLPRMQLQREITIDAENENEINNNLAEPLLNDEEMAESNAVDSNDSSNSNDNSNDNDQQQQQQQLQDQIPFHVLLAISVVIFWSAAALASLVSSIDVVWDLLGSSLSILMSYLIPAGTYLVISKRQGAKASTTIACYLLLLASVPLMVVSTANAVYNTFFKQQA